MPPAEFHAMTSAAPRKREAGPAWLAAFGALLALAAWTSVSNWRIVLGAGEVVPVDGDSAYHLRRILYALANGFALPSIDPWLRWPDGAACPWSDGFDVLAAAFVRMTGAAGGAPAAIRAALFPPVLGILVAWATVDLARLVLPREGRPPATLAAGLLVIFFPISVSTTRFGGMDHHVVEVLGLALLAGWALRRLPSAESAAPRSVTVFESAGVLAVVFVVWGFAGGVAYVAAIVPVLALAALREEQPRFAGSGAPALAIGAVASALLTAPALRAHGQLLAFQVPSLLQPLLVLAAAAAAALAVVAARLARGRAARAAIWAALVAAAGALLLLVPGVWREIAGGVGGWILREDAWIAGILEFQPVQLDHRTLAHLRYLFGPTGVVAPLALAAGGAWLARRSGTRGAAFALLAVALALALLLQQRFARVLAPFLAVSVAAALQALAAAVARGRTTRTAGIFIAGALPVVAAAALAVAEPAQRVILWPAPPQGAPAIVAAALDIRDAPAPSERGRAVFAQWDLGHSASVLAGRPGVVNGFGTYVGEEVFRRSRTVWRGTADDLEAFMDERDAGLLVAGITLAPELGAEDGRGAFLETSGGTVLDVDYLRARPLAVVLIAGSGLPRAGVRHLPHLMPRFASRQRIPGLSGTLDLPILWTYERVAGARLRGTAPPAARVVAAVELVERGRGHWWRAFADAGPDGTWEIVLPLPTRLARPTVTTGERYTIRAGEGPPASVEVPEHAVRAGNVVAVPALRGPG